jgi:hypothetical protein
MASTSEVGHAKNVANLETLLTICTSYGADYNPSNPAISIASLSTLLTNAKANLEAVRSFKNVLIPVINDRQNAFEPLKKLSTRVVSALDATSAPANLVKDAQSFNNKIQGSRSKPKPKKTTTATGTSEAAEAKAISASQLSYDNLIEHFASLALLASSAPTYTPNEVDLQPSSLNTLLTNLRTQNTAVSSAYTNYSNALISRNTVLYGPTSGVLDIVLEVKKYVKSVYGANSPQLKQLTKLNFKRAKK